MSILCWYTLQYNILLYPFLFLFFIMTILPTRSEMAVHSLASYIMKKTMVSNVGTFSMLSLVSNFSTERWPILKNVCYKSSISSYSIYMSYHFWSPSCWYTRWINHVRNCDQWKFTSPYSRLVQASSLEIYPLFTSL